MAIKTYFVLIDDNGQTIIKKKINKNELYINVDKEKYIVRREITPLEIKFFRKKYFYLYKKGNPEPLHFAGKDKNNFLTASEFNVMIETKVLQDLNKVSSSIFDSLNPKMIILVLCIIAVVIYFLTGGSVS